MRIRWRLSARRWRHCEGGGYQGHWEFDGEQNEYIAKYLFEGRCNNVTADIVYRAKMASNATP